MAEPGVLAWERADGRYDVFRAQWGGSDRTLAAVLSADSRELLSTADWCPGARAVRFHAWLDSLDYLRTSAVYVVCSRRRAAYCPMWFGLPTCGLVADPTLGALVQVRSVGDARRVRRVWRNLKGTLAEDLLAGRLPLAAAPLVLCEALGRRVVLSPLSRNCPVR